MLSTSKPHFFSSPFPLSLSLYLLVIRTPFYQILNFSWNEMSSSDSCLRSHSSPIPPRPAEIPPSKAPVGLAKPPDLKNVSSKIGSLANVKHKPGETHSPIRIFNCLLTFSSPFIPNLLFFIISTSFFTLLKVNHAFLLIKYYRLVVTDDADDLSGSSLLLVNYSPFLIFSILLILFLYRLIFSLHLWTESKHMNYLFLNLILIFPLLSHLHILSISIHFFGAQNPVCLLFRNVQSWDWKNMYNTGLWIPNWSSFSHPLSLLSLSLLWRCVRMVLMKIWSWRRQETRDTKTGLVQCCKI